MFSSRAYAAAVLSALAAAAITACAPQQSADPAAPRVPQITESQLREKARESLALGIAQYNAGKFAEASRSLAAALDHGQLTRPEQGSARKHLAFIYCTSSREPQCRDEFRKALEIDPGFELSAAEAGHPIWGPVYRDVRAKLSAPLAAPAPAAKPAAARSGAEGLLDQGLSRYAEGKFDAAAKLFAAALKQGLGAKSDQIAALKHSAFSLCLLNRRTACRNEFAKILKVDPAFDLAPAEAGHPSWGKVFADAKVRAQAERKSERGGATKR